jgi:uncharacterized coiled-coil protein SlyX
MDNVDNDSTARIKELEEENAKLRAIILSLNESIASKNRKINRMEYDSWDSVDFGRDR